MLDRLTQGPSRFDICSALHRCTIIISYIILQPLFNLSFRAGCPTALQASIHPGDGQALLWSAWHDWKKGWCCCGNHNKQQISLKGDESVIWRIGLPSFFSPYYSVWRRWSRGAPFVARAPPSSSLFTLEWGWTGRGYRGRGVLPEKKPIKHSGVGERWEKSWRFFPDQGRWWLLSGGADPIHRGVYHRHNKVTADEAEPFVLHHNRLRTP